MKKNTYLVCDTKPLLVGTQWRGSEGFSWVGLSGKHQALRLQLPDSLTVAEQRSPDLELIHRRQHYGDHTEIIEAFPDSWFLFFRSEGERATQVRSGTEFHDIGQGMALFLPPFALVHWKIQPGHYQWQAYRSRSPLPECLRTKAFRFPCPTRLTYEESDPLIQFVLSKLSVSQPVRVEQTNSVLARILKDRIDQTFRENLSLTELGRQIQSSSSNLSHCFHRCYGLSPVLYRNHLRLQQAVLELALDGKNVTETCYACGFEDFSRFYRNFRGYFGVKPSDFLRSSAFRSTSPF